MQEKRIKRREEEATGTSNKNGLKFDLNKKNWYPSSPPCPMTKKNCLLKGFVRHKNIGVPITYFQKTSLVAKAK